MLYSTLTVNNKDYKLRLPAKEICSLERNMGKNPVEVIASISEDNMPSIEDLIKILHASLQAFQHGTSLDDTYELFDEMVDEGKSFADLLYAVIEVFKCSGLVPTESEDKAKN